MVLTRDNPVMRTPGPRLPVAAGSEAAGMLRSVDASTNGGEVSPGRLPVDISEIGVSGIGENALGGGRSTPGGNADIFFVRPAEADALVRVTDTRTIHEFPLF